MKTNQRKFTTFVPFVALGLTLTALLVPVLSTASTESAASVAPTMNSMAADRASLLKGVTAIYAPGGLSATLILLSDTAFPVVTGSQSKERAPVVAAARTGRGRMVVYGHGNFIGKSGLSDPGTARLLTNAVRWSSAGRTDRADKNDTVRVGLLNWPDVAPTLRAAGFTVTLLSADALTPSGLAPVDVLVINPDVFGETVGKARAAVVQNWVRGGGGLITFGVGWGWQQLNPDRSLANDAGFNRLLVPMGAIGVDSGTADPTGPQGAFLTDGQELDIPTTASALARLEAVVSGRTTLDPVTLGPLTRFLVKASDVLPDDDTRYLPRLKALIAKAGPVVPTKYSPVGPRQPLERLTAVFEGRAMARTPTDLVKAHPSAAAFPGSVPAEAPRLLEQMLTVDTSVPDWHSTGLYAAPGEVITVKFPASVVGKGFAVRIGAHKDPLWNVDTWPRFPEITRERKITAPTMQIASAFGGTLYIVVPGNSTPGSIPVTVSGAVAQPYFVKGKTTAADWQNLRNAPAPWAEIQGDRIIITVPSSVVRNLRNPEAVAQYWDDVADAAADLYGIPHERKRQERYCVDIEISAGYMHSGYPIMTHDDVDRTFVNLAVLRGNDGNKTWGFYHELGHNHQRPDWTWAGLGEVTNNLFSLYADEKFNKVDSNYTNSHSAIAPVARQEMLTKYLAKGASLEGMTSDPFLTLTFFIQLRQGFGWEPFKKVFAEYRTLSDSERPKTELAKHDQFLMRFSKTVGRNLGPFFTAWGLRTSEDARKSVANLPNWRPRDWPTDAAIRAARQTERASR